jgi:hypothetical protein
MFGLNKTLRLQQKKKAMQVFSSSGIPSLSAAIFAVFPDGVLLPFPKKKRFSEVQ